MVKNGTVQAKEKKSYKMPAILVVVWALIIILFGYALWISNSNDNSNDDFIEEAAIKPAVEEDESLSDPTANMTEEQASQARIRDSKRLSDMKRLRAVLEQYKSDNEHYPETLDNLVPDYLEFLPQNPGPGGQPYVYTGIGTQPYGYYDLSYRLEVGAEGISAGLHVMSPGGLATP